MLYGGLRPQRCLLPCPHSQRIQAIPQASSLDSRRNKRIPIQSPAIWDLSGSTGLYEIGGRDDGSHKRTGCSDSALFGRLFNSEQLRPEMHRTEGQSDEHSKKPRVASEPEKVKAGTKESPGVPRPDTGFKHPSVLLARSQKGQNHSYGTKSEAKPFYDTKTSNVPVRVPLCMLAGGPVGTNTHEGSAVGYPDQPAGFRRPLGTSYYASFKNYSFPSLVGGQKQLVQRDPLGGQDHTCNYHRSCGMGSTHGHRCGSRGMEKSRTKSLLESKRTASSKLCLESLFASIKGPSCPDILGQPSNSGLYKPPGGNQVQNANGGILRDIQVSRGKLTVPIGATHTGSREPDSRLSELYPTTSRGVGSKSVRFSEDCGNVGNPRHRLICRPQEQKSGSILFSKSQGESSDPGRIYAPMDTGTTVCLPTDHSPPGGDKESQGRGGSGNTYSPFLAKKNMVFMAQNNVSNRPLGSTRSPRPSIAGSWATPPSSEPPFNSMEFERSLLRGKGFSENLISTLQKSRKPITIKAYGRTWRKFLSSSGTKVQDGIQMDKILEFLQRGLEQGLATNTLRVQVAALGALYNQEVASDPWVSRFMRAAARSRPIATQKIPSWDLNLVLSALTGPPFEPIQSAPLKTL
ncbi:RNA-binding protein Musashi homolog 2 isoform X1 [Dendrobates tinctorius]|uniref:RNA-binding protein Musashi homolog 2 isoform X1 n=1 Tax=Dendrobates tinctorius TaxID=92724 RepID=UPI003CCA0A0C